MSNIKPPTCIVLRLLHKHAPITTIFGFVSTMSYASGWILKPDQKASMKSEFVVKDQPRYMVRLSPTGAPFAELMKQHRAIFGSSIVRELPDMGIYAAMIRFLPRFGDCQESSRSNPTLPL